MSFDKATTIAIREAMRVWFSRERRSLPWRATRDPYAIWVSEVMLQQTQVKTVVPYYGRFMAQFPTVQHLARADLHDVLKAWEGLGYYSRARNLLRAAQKVVALFSGQIPDRWEDIRQLPGVGDYIAAAVLSIAYAGRWAVVDGNVKRVLARLCKLSDPVNSTGAHKVFQAFADQLLDRDDPGDFNQAMMELGATLCTPHKPLCGSCPLNAWCQAVIDDVVSVYPRRVQRPKTPQHCLTAAIIYKEGRILIVRRPAEGLLGGLWEFPAQQYDPRQDPAQACLQHLHSGLHLTVVVQKQVATIRQAYTHFKIRMELFVCLWRGGELVQDGLPELQWPEYRWIDPTQIGRYALHRAAQKALPYLQTAAPQSDFPRS